MRTKTLEEDTTISDDNKLWYHGNSHYFAYPEDIFLIVNEQCLISSSTNTAIIPFIVVPINYDDYTRLMQKPYKYPLKGQVWKLVTSMRADSWESSDTGTGSTITTGSTLNGSTSTSNGGGTLIEEPEDARKEYKPIVELAGVRNIFDDQLVKCKIRYVRRPEPIILDDLRNIDENLRIHGMNKENQCKLPAHFHAEIIQRAVELAKAAWQGDLNTTIQMGDRKE